MKNTFYLIFITILAIGLASVACEGPAGPQGEQGQQGDQGPEGEQGPQGSPGEDGNANVTLYTFPSHDFSEDDLVNFDDGFFIDGIGVLETAYNTWLIYLQYIYSNGDVGYFLMPGIGVGLERYWSVYGYDDNHDGIAFAVGLIEGDGEAYSGIHVFRIASNAVEDCTDGSGCKRADTAAIPADLDLSDYQAVMDYYGVTEEDAVRVSSQ